MKRFLMLLTITLTCLSLFSVAAEARRFGGGGSFGRHRTMAPQRAQRSSTTAAGATKPANKWLGPLAGLAIGAGLASMFAGGFGGGGMGGILMALLAAGVVMFLISKFRKPQNAMHYAGVPYQQPVHEQDAGGSAATLSEPSRRDIPENFPVEGFLRSAKTTFIRLQAANDRKDLNDIREYTTPEMFAEIAMQIQERDSTPQITDVISIHGDLLEVTNEGDGAIASVRFTGQLRENNTTPENVDEIWHVQKNLKEDQSMWLLAGIQQTTLH
ncbi:MAG: Tim44-like domain-containing protein [Gallionella sp.]